MERAVLAVAALWAGYVVMLFVGWIDPAPPAQCWHQIEKECKP